MVFKKRHISWCKGLTKNDDERIKIVAKQKELNLDEERIIFLYKEKFYSIYMIAKEMKCSSTPIKRILRDNNLKIRSLSKTRQNLINLGYFKVIIPKGRKSSKKGKSFEEFYGEERAKKIKNKISRTVSKILTGRECSEETKTKISESNKGRKQKPFTLEQLSKIGEKSKRWHREKKGTEIYNSWKKKVINSKLGKKFPKKLYPNYSMRNKKHSKEAIKKIKERRALQVIPMNDTLIEQKIQKFLTLLHIQFFTHKYVSEINHSYQCDILIPKQETDGIIISQKTIIECDGCYFHNCPICKLRSARENKLDKIRTKELQEKGFRVIRLWEHEIKPMQLNDFKEKIK